jgi:hypothetical protein
MATDKSGIRIQRVGPDEETAALPANPETPTSPRRRTGGTTRPRTPTTRPSTADVVDGDRDAATAAPPREERDTGWKARLAEATSRETKPSFLTSELLLTLATVAALLVAGYLHDDSLNTWRTWLLVTVISSAYVLSRGIAKAGSHDRR